MAEDKILSHVEKKPYFIDGNFVLYHDDCLKILEQIPEYSIDKSNKLKKILNFIYEAI